MSCPCTSVNTLYCLLYYILLLTYISLTPFCELLESIKFTLLNYQYLHLFIDTWPNACQIEAWVNSGSHWRPPKINSFLLICKIIQQTLLSIPIVSDFNNIERNTWFLHKILESTQGKLFTSHTSTLFGLTLKVHICVIIIMW